MNAPSVEELVADRFRFGDRRSDAYKAGFRAAAERLLIGTGAVAKALQYPEGSPERDAFFAGLDDGYAFTKARL